MDKCSSLYSPAIGYYLNCCSGNGSVKRLFLSESPEYEPGPDPALERVSAFLEGSGENILDIPVEPEGTPFQVKVWQALREIPAGEVRTYSWVAHRIGRDKAVRAVANTVGSNRITILIPCHRVVAKSGPGGFSAVGGVETKRRILAAEGFELPQRM